ncbi:MAG: DUF6631 family protein [Cypionkella sp.]
MSGLDDITPKLKQLTVAGRDFVLSPVRMGQLSAFSDAVMPIVPMVLAGRILEAATQHYEAMKAALVIAVKADPEWLDGLMPDDFLKLVAAVVEVNGDFFVRRLTPIILVMQAQMQAAIDQVGAPSLPTLDATDTLSRLS